jgi:putative flippase GtrA
MSPVSRWIRSRLLQRWLKFNAVGVIGLGVQLAALATLADGLRCNLSLATLVAVEAAVLHNFFCHRRWTWTDRLLRPGDGSPPAWTNRRCSVAGATAAGSTCRETLTSLLRFHVAGGLTSLAGNLGLTALLVGYAHVHYLAAGLIAVAACSTLNFVLADRFVFRSGGQRPKDPC